MKVIFTGTREPRSHVNVWQERYGPSDFVPIGSILDILEAKYQEISAEAIVIETSELFYVEGPAEDEYVQRRRMEARGHLSPNAFALLGELLPEEDEQIPEYQDQASGLSNLVFDIALVCGYPVPTDIMKDTHISVSALYTPQNLVHAHVRFSKSMMSFPEDTLPYLNPKAPSGTRVLLHQTTWFKAVLLPKNTDMANIQKLSDVIAVGGKLGREWPTAPTTKTIVIP